MADGGNIHANLLHGNGQNIPAHQPVPQDAWYYGFLSTLWSQCDKIRRLCSGSCFGKLEALFQCLCLPCSVLIEAVNEQRTIYLQQIGVVYLYLFLSLTVVVNLVVPLKKIEVPVAENIQKYFVLWLIGVAMVKMFYLWLFTSNTAEYRNWSLRVRAGYPPEALMRVFYQGGLYLFGFSSLGYSLVIVINNVACGRALTATVNAMKALYIVVQTLFLNKFYKARIPDSTRGIQFVLAHLLGTNLALWFWTLCSEEISESTECTGYPIPLGSTEKYFSPLFVEYLLIAASLFYQIWKDLLPTQAVAAPHCRTCACQLNAGNGDVDERRNEGGGAGGARAAIRGNLGLGVVTGCCFGVVFIILVIVSTANGETHQIYHFAYSVGIIILYVTQMFACYVILLSAQSLAWDAQRSSIDHDDALLYLSLVGSLLWEGFHLYSLLLIDIDPTAEKKLLVQTKFRNLDMIADALAMLQYVFQTTTLITLRRHQPTQNRRMTAICQCVLFLLTTNIGLWIENSFFVEIVITTPGEHLNTIQKYLKPIGYIVHPLNIFFRFHSAVCCLIAWSIFRT